MYNVGLKYKQSKNYRSREGNIGEGGGTQYHKKNWQNTKISFKILVKYQNTTSKIDKIPVLHSVPFITSRTYLKLHPSSLLTLFILAFYSLLVDLCSLLYSFLHISILNLCTKTCFLSYMRFCTQLWYPTHFTSLNYPHKTS